MIVCSRVQGLAGGDELQRPRPSTGEQSDLPPWARDNAQEWERLASRANTEMLTTLTFEARVLELQPAWLVVSGGVLRAYSGPSEAPDT